MAESDYVASRAVGDATVTAINDASGLSSTLKTIPIPEDVYRREVATAPNGDVQLGYHTAHVRFGSASILIDLGFDDPSPNSQWHAPRHRRTPGLTAGLASIGVQPTDITHVLITHNHGDHVAGGSVERNGQRTPRFPNARHYIGRLDWEGVAERERPTSLLATHLGPVERAGLLQTIDGDQEILPGVWMIHSPGETPGHSLVRVQSAGATYYFLGDLFHHPCEVAHLDWVPERRDPEQMLASRRRLVADALAGNALLMTAHMRFPCFGRIERSAGGSTSWVSA